MKALTVSIILFTLILAITISNIFYTTKSIDKMKALALDVIESERSEEALEELSIYWNKHKKILSLSAGFREIDRVTEQLVCMVAAYESGNSVMLRQSSFLFCNALDDIIKYEKITFDVIF